jgi:hypothetical protein
VVYYKGEIKARTGLENQAQNVERFILLTLARPIIKVKLFSMRFCPAGFPAGFSRIYERKAGFWTVLFEQIPVVEVLL